MKTKFEVFTFHKDSFEETVNTFAKKFKIDCELVYSEKIKLASDSNGHPLYGYTVDIVSSDIEKFYNTGFTFLGSIKNEEGHTLIIPSRYSIDNGYTLSELKEEIKTFPCHECHKKISRKIIHIFKEDKTGEITVYGSGCAIKKFGIDLAKFLNKFGNLIEKLNEVSEENNWGSCGGYIPDYADEWCKLAYFEISNNGYTSGSKAYERGIVSTVNEIHEIKYLLHGNERTTEVIKAREIINNSLRELDYNHKEFIEWAENYVEELDDNDFSFNMKASLDLIKDNYVTSRTAGYTTFLVFKFWNELNNTPKSKIEWNTDYDYSEGDKIKKLEVEVIDDYIFNGSYGTTHIYTMKGDDNIKYKWFTQKELEKGKKYFITSCSVKKLEDDKKYGKAVVITRCRVRK